MAKYTAETETIRKAGEAFQNQVAPAIEGLRQQIQAIASGELSGENWDDTAHDKFVQIAEKYKTTLAEAKQFLEYVGGELIWQAQSIQDTSDESRTILR